MSISKMNVSTINWRNSVQNRHAFQNMQSVARLASVLDGLITPASGNYDQTKLNASKFSLPHSLYSWLENSRTDTLLIYKEQNCLFEWHAPDVDPAKPHLLFSISKSITGLVAEMLLATGVIKADAWASHYLKWPKPHCFDQISLRQMMNMEVPVDFTEGDDGTNVQFQRYRAAMGWDKAPEGFQNETLATFLQTLKIKERDDAAPRFQYSSPICDTLGLVLEAATRQSLCNLMADHVLKPAQCVGPASMTIDKDDAPRAAGGLCMTPHDLAKIGLAMLNPPNALFKQGRDAVLAPRDQTSWQKGDFPELFPQGSYKSYWYRTGDKNGAYCAIGIHGQWLWINPEQNIVIVRLASEFLPEDDVTEQECLKLFRDIA